MFARKFVVLAVLLMGVAPAYGAFDASLYMDGGSLTNGGLVEEATPIQLVVWDDQTWNNAIPHEFNRLTSIQLNFDASTIAMAGAAWAWDTGIASAFGAGPTDDVVPDGLVYRNGYGSWPDPDAASFSLGTLSFNAPAYIPAGNNTYTVSLGGGIFDEGTGEFTVTTLIGKELDDYAMAATGALAVEDFTFTVTPEPATIALLAMGGAAMLIRRKR